MKNIIYFFVLLILAFACHKSKDVPAPQPNSNHSSTYRSGDTLFTPGDTFITMLFYDTYQDSVIKYNLAHNIPSIDEPFNYWHRYGFKVFIAYKINYSDSALVGVLNGRQPNPQFGNYVGDLNWVFDTVAINNGIIHMAPEALNWDTATSPGTIWRADINIYQTANVGYGKASYVNGGWGQSETPAYTHPEWNEVYDIKKQPEVYDWVKDLISPDDSAVVNTLMSKW